jgi:hypothetical protein
LKKKRNWKQLLNAQQVQIAKIVTWVDFFPDATRLYVIAATLIEDVGVKNKRTINFI